MKDSSAKIIELKVLMLLVSQGLTESFIKRNNISTEELHIFFMRTMTWAEEVAKEAIEELEKQLQKPE